MNDKPNKANYQLVAHCLFSKSSKAKYENYEKYYQKPKKK